MAGPAKDRELRNENLGAKTDMFGAKMTALAT